MKMKKSCISSAGSTYPDGETPQVKARLYSTEFCHLCVTAEAIISQLELPVTLIDIAAQDELLISYGTRIPVLQRIDNGAELNWPFDAITVSRFMT